MPPRTFVDFLAFSSLLPAAVAFGLTRWSGHLLGAPTPGRWALLAAAGTFAVYGVDRLRDVDRDRRLSPERTGFIERHGRRLQAGMLLAALLFLGSLLYPEIAPPGVFAICAGVGALGLLHRRLKRPGGATKALYVTLAWLGCVFGVPWLAAGRPPGAAALALALAAVLGANLVAANLRDLPPDRQRRMLWIARGGVALSLGCVAWAPDVAWPIGWVAGAEGAALLRFAPGERYRLIALDGALAVGCALASLHAAWAAAAA